jgi:hypothetical protein
MGGCAMTNVLLDTSDFTADVESYVRILLRSQRRPSPAELVGELDRQLGLKARWDLVRIIAKIARYHEFTKIDRDYLELLLAEDGLAKALRGEDAPAPKSSTIDDLFKHSKLYQSSEKFRELVQFMGKFRKYNPAIGLTRYDALYQVLGMCSPIVNTTRGI